MDGAAGMSPDALLSAYRGVRAQTVALAAPLSAEDQCVQAMPDASPTKWHLAHTSWFFEAIILQPLLTGYRVFDPHFLYLFNSYYEGLGARQPRPERGMITRPPLAAVLDYRAHVDEAVERLIASITASRWDEARALIELGLHHEQQHQELLLTDIKALFALNPFEVVYQPAGDSIRRSGKAAPLDWIAHREPLVQIGHEGAGFCFDNERPRFEVRLYPYALSNRLVTCAEFLAFMNDGGYERAQWWLADGWTLASECGWKAPLYWREDGAGGWRVRTLHGERAIDPDEPVCHVSYYEASAYAAWADARLPTEFEWEAAVAALPLAGHFYEQACLHPRAAVAGSGLLQAYGDAWCWTRSSYDPYPGFAPLSGAVAEYNGKFMVGQLVLRGGSCVSPVGHLRATYRNFFPPAARWQFSGIRLARNL